MMKRKIFYFMFLFLTATFAAAWAEQPIQVIDKAPRDVHPSISTPTPHHRIEGTVEKIEGDMISLKLETGVTRRSGVVEAKKEGIKSLKEGDQVALEVNEANLIVDMHKDGAMAQNKEKHRSVVGTVEQFDPLQKKVTIKTEEGKSETYEIKMPVVAKLSGINQGAKVTVEIDEQNRVMDVHKG
jgi:Cu/Ag efflux protein CusF